MELSPSVRKSRNELPLSGLNAERLAPQAEGVEALGKRIAASLLAALFLSTGVFAADFKAEVRGDHIRFELNVSELGNLVYHLDCLSGLLPGSLPAYRELWLSRLGWTADDSNLLTRWEAIHRSVAITQLPSMVRQWGISYPPIYSATDDPVKRLVANGIRSTSMEEFRENVGHNLPESDVEELVRILHQFRSRFKSWWDDTAEKEGFRIARRIEEVLRLHSLVNYAEDAGPLFEVDLERLPTFSFDFMVRPKTTREQIEGGQETRSMQVETRAIIETAYDLTTARQAEPLLHEFVHYLHAQSPLSRRIDFLRACLSEGNPHALSLYNILDEVLATAIGNGLVARRMMYGRDFLRVYYQDQSFYGDRVVDRVAKALVPIIKDRLDTGKSLFNGFALEYLDVARGALGDLAASPLLALRFRSIVCEDPEMQSLVSIFRARVPGVSSIIHYSLDNWAREAFPDLSGVVFVPTRRLRESLEALGTPVLQGAPLLETLSHKYEAFVYRMPHTRHSSLYLFVGDNAAVISDLLRDFSMLDAPFEGLGMGKERSIGPLAGSQ